MCCPVLRIDESIATVLALDVSTGNRLWSIGLARPNSVIEECFNLYSDASLIAQIGRGRTGSGNNIHVRFSDAFTGEQIAQVDIGQAVNIADVTPIKTDNYYWLYGGLATGTRKWFVFDASDYTFYGTANVAYSVSQFAANPVSGSDSVYAIDTFASNVRFIDKDGTATSSTISGVTTITNATLLDNGNAAIRYNAGNLIGVVDSTPTLVSTSSVAGEALRDANGAYVVAADFSGTSDVIEVWDTNSLNTGSVWSHTDTSSQLNGALYAKPSPDGNSAYVIDSDGRTLHKFTSAGLAWSVAVSIAGYFLVKSIEFDDDGNLILVYGSNSVLKFDPSIPGFVNIAESFATKRLATDGSSEWTTKFYKSEAAFESGGFANGFRLQGDIVYLYGSRYTNA
jgi:hypothetical protein